jgi:hypothetical protein
MCPYAAGSALLLLHVKHLCPGPLFDQDRTADAMPAGDCTLQCVITLRQRVRQDRQCHKNCTVCITAVQPAAGCGTSKVTFTTSCCTCKGASQVDLNHKHRWVTFELSWSQSMFNSVKLHALSMCRNQGSVPTMTGMLNVANDAEALIACVL